MDCTGMTSPGTPVILQAHSPKAAQSPKADRCFSAYSRLIPTSVKKKTPPEKNTLAEISLKSTTSGAGEEFVLLFCRAQAHGKGVFFHRHR